MSPAFEAFLDDISRCFTLGNLSLWRRRLRLPFTLVAKDGPVVLETEAAVAENFGHYQMAMDIMRIDLVHRRAISLEDCQDGVWLGTFETRLLSAGQLATAPYTATALLHLTEGHFLMSSMLNGRGHQEWTGVRGR